MRPGLREEAARDEVSEARSGAEHVHRKPGWLLSLPGQLLETDWIEAHGLDATIFPRWEGNRSQLVRVRLGRLEQEVLE